MKQLTQVKPTDRSKIDVASADALKQWAHNLGVTRDQLRFAIAKVGNSAAIGTQTT